MKLPIFLLVIAILVTSLCVVLSATEPTVYVSGDSAGGDGSREAPFATLKDAVSYFKGKDGGKIVVTSALQIPDAYEISCNSKEQIIITAEGGGKLVFAGKFYINAPIKFENIQLSFSAKIPMIFCEGNNVTFGGGIVNSYSNYAPIIYGGTYGGKKGITYEKMCFSDYTVRIESGTWYYVKGGSCREGEEQPVGTLSNVALEIAGGVFTAKGGSSENAFISLTGFDALLGDGRIDISGGNFTTPIVAIARPGYNATTTNNQYVKGNVYINVSGGTFIGNEICAVQDKVASEIDGDFYVNITGGNFVGFTGVDAAAVNGLAIAEVPDDVAVKNFDSLITVTSSDKVSVTGDALIRVSGTVPVSAFDISGDGKVIIEGETPDAKIKIDSTFKLGSNTEFRNIALNGGGTNVIDCAGGKVLFGEGISGSGVALKNFTDATLRSGLFAYVRGAEGKDVKLHIDGATVSSNVVAAAGSGMCDAYVIMSAGKVGGDIYAFESTGKNGAVHVYGGEIKGKIAASKTPSADCVNVFGAVAPSGTEISYKGCEKYCAPAEAVFVADGGEGDGKTPLSPLGSLAEAVKVANGKTVVVCGPIKLTKTLSLPEAEKTVITSEYMGVNYRDFFDAHIQLSSGICTGGATVFENIDFVAFEKYTFINGMAHPLTIGEGVECYIFEGKRVEKYPALVGLVDGDENAVVNVASGTWSVLSGGYYYDSESVYDATVKGNINVTVTGGRFMDGVYLAGRSVAKGNAVLTVYGGTFECPVRATYKSGSDILGKGEINLYGGEFFGDIIGGGKDFTLNIAGADLDRVCTVDVQGKLNLGATYNLDAKIKGTASFTNPIAGYADPSVVYHDGWYYYSFAKNYEGKPALWMAKSPNIFDIGNAEQVLVWAESKSNSSTVVKSLWAPQLYFLDGKWYLYATCDIGLTAVGDQARRMPIIWRALTDDPIGEYEYIGQMKNTDTNVCSYLSPRIIEHGGKTYMFNGGFYRAADATGQHLQRLFGCELSDPLTMGSAVQLVSSPSYGYEVELMEGPYPFYAPDGTLYMIFAAGHTRTDEYCTGLMRFIGSESDSLLDASKWVKYDTPLHEVSYENKVYSPGAMVVARGEDGQYLAVYHAKEYHYSAYTMRRMYVQEMTFENGLPVVEEPQPTDTVFTFKLASTPLGERIKGYTEKGFAAQKLLDEIADEGKYVLSEFGADVNKDGSLGLIDALLVAKAILDGNLSASEKAKFDLNFDGALGIADMRIVIREILEK